MSQGIEQLTSFFMLLWCVGLVLASLATWRLHRLESRPGFMVACIGGGVCATLQLFFMGVGLTSALDFHPEWLNELWAMEWLWRSTSWLATAAAAALHLGLAHALWSLAKTVPQPTSPPASRPPTGARPS